MSILIFLKLILYQDPVLLHNYDTKFDDILQNQLKCEPYKIRKIY